MPTVLQNSFSNAPLYDVQRAGGGDNILDLARERAAVEKLSFAGSVSPLNAWTLFTHKEAVIVDVRSAEERKFVGHVPDTLHVPWATGLSLNRNPRFVGELGTKVKKDQVILFLCRSGKRSALAAEAASKAGYKQAFNILEGFEGDLNGSGQRGDGNGWRFHGLPWIQD